jgi:hypothetical protein
VSPWGLRSNVRIPADVFTHIAVGYGGGRSKIYINGTLRGSQREGAQAVDVDTNVLVGAIHGAALTAASRNTSRSPCPQRSAPDPSVFITYARNNTPDETKTSSDPSVICLGLDGK